MRRDNAGQTFQLCIHLHVDHVSNVHDKNLENMHCNSSSCVLQITAVSLRKSKFSCLKAILAYTYKD